jgi:hypothetical protein
MWTTWDCSQTPLTKWRKIKQQLSEHISIKDLRTRINQRSQWNEAHLMTWSYLQPWTAHSLYLTSKLHQHHPRKIPIWQIHASPHTNGHEHTAIKGTVTADWWGERRDENNPIPIRHWIPHAHRRNVKTRHSACSATGSTVHVKPQTSALDSNKTHFLIPQRNKGSHPHYGRKNGQSRVDGVQWFRFQNV